MVAAERYFCSLPHPAPHYLEVEASGGRWGSSSFPNPMGGGAGASSTWRPWREVNLLQAPRSRCLKLIGGVGSAPWGEGAGVDPLLPPPRLPGCGSGGPPRNRTPGCCAWSRRSLEKAPPEPRSPAARAPYLRRGPRSRVGSGRAGLESPDLKLTKGNSELPAHAQSRGHRLPNLEPSRSGHPPSGHRPGP